jgi:hypothetical protein
MKDFDFNIFYQPPAEIREHKNVGYTVKVISGKEEYKAYMEQKAMRLHEEQKAKQEAYLLRRSFASEIVAGRAKASDEALKPSPTLARFRQQFGDNTTHIPVQPSIRGLLEWYKEQLAKAQFEGGEK